MIKVEISLRGMILLFVAFAMSWAIIELWPVLLLVLVAFILMLGLLPYVDAMTRGGVPRTGAVLLIVFAILGLVIAAFSLMVPPMVDEFQNVKDNLPETARESQDFLSGIGINVELEQRAREINWNELINGRTAVDAGQRLLSTSLSLLTILVMTAYLLADTPRLARFIDQFIPDNRKDEANRLFLSVSSVVGGYLRGQFITSMAIGLFTFALLSIVGVPNPLAFAVLAAFADVVPLVGALVATVPPVAAALQESPAQALITLVALLAYQQFEDRILAPRIYGRTLNLPPIIVLIAVLAGAELMGITGVLLALPLTAAGRVGIDYVIEHRRLPLTQPIDEPLAPDRPAPKSSEEPEAEERHITRRPRRRPKGRTAGARRA